MARGDTNDCRDPRAKKCHRQVRAAVSAGILVRPEACERCGEIPDKAKDGRAVIHGHHHDYAKPLEVEWICPKCHRAETKLPDVMGAPVFGERNGQAKMNPEKVARAKELRASGLTYREMSEIMGVSQTCLRYAVNGNCWGWIAASEASG